MNDLHARILADLDARQQQDEPLREDKMRVGARIAAASDEAVERLAVACVDFLADDLEAMQ